MSNSEKNIDQLFKQKLEDFELPSHDSSWKLLQLVKESSFRRRRISFLKSIFEYTLLAASLSVILLSSEVITPKSTIQDKYFIEKTPSLFKIEVAENDNTIQTAKSSPEKQPLNIHDNTQKINITSKTHQTLTNDIQFNLKPISPTNNIENKQQLVSSAITSYASWTETSLVSIHKINEAEINSSYDEYAPVLSSDGSFMFFTSRRPITNKEIRKGQGKERIFYSETSENGWTKTKLLDHPLNSDKNFSSAVALSNDGTSLFIYRDDRYGNGDFYESRLQNSQWSEPKPLPAPINSKYHESSLSLSADRNTLYFTSNRKGGIGGMDIWYVQKNKAGIWGEAQNLGDKINTKGDEEGVFIHPNGKTLYFSSRGHEGYGGYDIYSTTLEEGKWTTPVNLGPEINTSNDDVYFVLTANEKDAFYASVNPSTPDKKDIFKVRFNHKSHQQIKSQEHSLLKGSIKSKTDKKPIQATIEIYRKDNTEPIKIIKSDQQTGAFSTSLPNEENYHIRVFKRGFLHFTDNISMEKKDNYTVIKKDILLDQLNDNSQFTLIRKLNNKTSLTAEVYKKLDDLLEVMKNNPKLTFNLILELGVNEKNVNKTHKKFMKDCSDYLASKEFAIETNIILQQKTKEKVLNINKLTVYIE